MPRQLTPDEQTQMDHLKSQLTTYLRNLRHLEGQAVGHGGEKLAPIFVINQHEHRAHHGGDRCPRGRTCRRQPARDGQREC
jgi:hypothetical protein